MKLCNPVIGIGPRSLPLVGAGTWEQPGPRIKRQSGEGSHGSGQNTNKTKRVRKVAAWDKNERGQVQAKSERGEVFCRTRHSANLWRKGSKKRAKQAQEVSIVVW